MCDAPVGHSGENTEQLISSESAAGESCVSQKVGEEGWDILPHGAC